MKKIVFSLLLLAPLAGSLSSCREQSKIPEPEVESVPLILPQINSAKSYFDIATSRASEASNPTRPVFEFTVNPSEVSGVQLQTVEVYKSFVRNGILGPRVKYKDLTSFPTTVSINSQDAITDLYLTNNPPPVTVPATPAPLPIKATISTGTNRILNGGNDGVVFTFEYVLSGGRRIILTPLTTTGITGVVTGSRAAAPFAAIAYFK